jgi:hypothetical protein
MHISGLSGLKVNQLWSPRWGQRGLRGKPAKQRWTVGSAQWLVDAPPQAELPRLEQDLELFSACSSVEVLMLRYCRFCHRMLDAACTYQGSPHAACCLAVEVSIMSATALFTARDIQQTLPLLAAGCSQSMASLAPDAPSSLASTPRCTIHILCRGPRLPTCDFKRRFHQRLQAELGPFSARFRGRGRAGATSQWGWRPN